MDDGHGLQSFFGGTMVWVLSLVVVNRLDFCLHYKILSNKRTLPSFFHCWKEGIFEKSFDPTFTKLILLLLCSAQPLYLGVQRRKTKKNTS